MTGCSAWAANFASCMSESEPAPVSALQSLSEPSERRLLLVELGGVIRAHTLNLCLPASHPGAIHTCI